MPALRSPRPPPISESHARSFRLRRHHLDRPAPRSRLVDVVRDTAGIQAQVPSAAGLSLRCRVRGLRRDDVARALERDRTLVRGWMVRHAVHLVPAADFLLYVRGQHGRVARAQAWFARAGLTGARADAIVDAIATALEDGPLTRKALAERVVARQGEGARRWVEHAWGGLVQFACLRGRVCFGPPRKGEVVFASVGSWLPDLPDVEPREAGRALVGRYLRAFGPATPQDFRYWTEMLMADVRPIWAAARDDLTRVSLDGREAWAVTEDLPSLRRAAPPGPVVNLLPNFDAFLLGHRDKGHLVDPAHYKRVYRKAGWIAPAVLLDGRVAGVWGHEQRGERVSVTVEPFLRFGPAVRRRVQEEATDLGRFLESRDVRVRFT